VCVCDVSQDSVKLSLQTTMQKTVLQQHLIWHCANLYSYSSVAAMNDEPVNGSFTHNKIYSSCKQSIHWLAISTGGQSPRWRRLKALCWNL